MLPEILGEWIEVNRFDTCCVSVLPVVFAPPLGLADPVPVGGLVAGTLVAFGVYKCFSQGYFLGIEPLPVADQYAQIGGKRLGCQMLDTHPRQDEEANVVHYLCADWPGGFGHPNR